LYKNSFLVGMLDTNSEQADYGPASRDNILYFNSNRLIKPRVILAEAYWPLTNFSQLFFLVGKRAPSSGSVKALPLKGAYSKLYGPIAFHPVTNELYLTKNYYSDQKKLKRSKDLANLEVFKTPFNSLDSKAENVASDALDMNYEA
jgi:hypothetical protein